MTLAQEVGAALALLSGSVAMDQHKALHRLARLEAEHPEEFASAVAEAKPAASFQQPIIIGYMGQHLGDFGPIIAALAGDKLTLSPSEAADLAARWFKDAGRVDSEGSWTRTAPAAIKAILDRATVTIKEELATGGKMSLDTKRRVEAVYKLITGNTPVASQPPLSVGQRAIREACNASVTALRAATE
jgi:hypothetical protein